MVKRGNPATLQLFFLSDDFSKTKSAVSRHQRTQTATLQCCSVAVCVRPQPHSHERRLPVGGGSTFDLTCVSLEPLSLCFQLLWAELFWCLLQEGTCIPVGICLCGLIINQYASSGADGVVNLADLAGFSPAPDTDIVEPVVLTNGRSFFSCCIQPEAVSQASSSQHPMNVSGGKFFQ